MSRKLIPSRSSLARGGCGCACRRETGRDRRFQVPVAPDPAGEARAAIGPRRPASRPRPALPRLPSRPVPIT